MKRHKRVPGACWTGVLCLSLIAANINVHANTAQAQTKNPEASKNGPEEIDEIRFDGSTRMDSQGGSSPKPAHSGGLKNSAVPMRGGTGGGTVPYIRGVGPSFMFAGPGAASLLNQMPGPNHAGVDNHSFTPKPGFRHAAAPLHTTEPETGSEDSIGGIGGIPGPDSAEGQAITAESNSAAASGNSNATDPMSMFNQSGAGGGLNPAMLMNLGGAMGGGGSGGTPGTSGMGSAMPGLAGGDGGGAPDLGKLMQQLGGGGGAGMDPTTMLKQLQQMQQYGNALSGPNDGSNATETPPATTDPSIPPN